MPESRWQNVLRAAVARSLSLVLRAACSPVLFGVLAASYTVMRLYAANMSAEFPMELGVESVGDALLFLPRLLGGTALVITDGAWRAVSDGPAGVWHFAGDVLGLEATVVRQVTEAAALRKTRRLLAILPWLAAANLLGAVVRHVHRRRSRAARQRCSTPAFVSGWVGTAAVTCSIALCAVVLCHCHYLQQTAMVKGAARFTGIAYTVANLFFPLLSETARLIIRVPALLVRYLSADLSSSLELFYDRHAVLFIHYLDALTPEQSLHLLCTAVLTGTLGGLLLGSRVGTAITQRGQSPSR